MDSKPKESVKSYQVVLFTPKVEVTVPEGAEILRVEEISGQEQNLADEKENLVEEEEF